MNIILLSLPKHKQRAIGVDARVAWVSLCEELSSRALANAVSVQRGLSISLQLWQISLGRDIDIASAQLNTSEHAFKHSVGNFR